MNQPANPPAGSLSAGGWFNSPAGAYAADPAQSGKATFEGAAVYKKNAPALAGSIAGRWRTLDGVTDVKPLDTSAF